jgi:hypothetical protein
LQVDAGEDHRQLCRPQFDAVGFARAGYLEAACLKPLDVAITMPSFLLR